MSKTPDTLEYRHLIIRLVQGDERAFEELYKLFSEKIYHIARRMNLSHEDAEGVVQEVFLKIWKNRSKLDPELSINAYLIAIVRSLVIKKAKKDARFFAFQQYKIPLVQQISSPGADDELIFSEFSQLTKEIIEQLPPAQKRIFQLRYFENLSVSEIADQLNISKRTVENQVFRSTSLVREKLTKLKIISSGLLFFVIDSLLLALMD
ncbi:RNA polymerase sigma-70 factor (ECF subfamily) [Algoriphagus aquaeductus]|uniref:RNA polymerase sigma-70 factor (ECF subfamily) n=1 Tax=Algoriphagus aquaeductus TaxID=475299 RepID=A0A326S0K0_9BACT|nr:sigma-70 family RNA polymerase sigma factor [Algoriphagus aquaeductus]PZV87157.1 RNA polymerase sigma-70 factor (ECF subfamily) [Algoriphagus aquaeductus]